MSSYFEGVPWGLAVDELDVYDGADAYDDGDVYDEADDYDAVLDEDDFLLDVEPVAVTRGMREALSDDYADASDDDVNDALAGVLDELSPEESFNFSKALGQVGKAAGGLMADPNVAAYARTLLPVAGGTLGTAFGGPVGGAALGQLGRAAAGAFPGRPPGLPAPAAQVAGQPAASAAVKSVVLANDERIRQALLAAALGTQGRQQVAGVPVAQLLGLLSQMVGQAAAEADEMMYGIQEASESELFDSSDLDADTVYAALIGGDAFDDAFDDEGGAW